MSRDPLAGRDGFDTREHFQQSGFARAVFADKSDTVSPFEDEVDARINLVIPIGFVNLEKLQNPLARTQRGRKAEPDLGPVHDRGFDFLHFIQELQAALHLACGGRPDPASFNEPFDLADPVLLVPVGGELDFLPFRPFP